MTTQDSANNKPKVQEDPSEAPIPASASASCPPTNAATATAPTQPTASSSGTLAEALYAVETLVQLFGFSVEAANEAVNEVGTDVTQCYNYVLDRGLGKDTGGAVYPISNCPHIATAVQISPGNYCFGANASLAVEEWPCEYTCLSRKNHEFKTEPKGGQKGETGDDGSCPKGENWLCLYCGHVFCSRYVNGHGLQHWKDTRSREPTGADVSSCHCIAVSLADLSVWCHECSAYLIHNDQALKPIVEELERLKFPEKA